jgi:hypothetical protein
MYEPPISKYPSILSIFLFCLVFVGLSVVAFGLFGFFDDMYGNLQYTTEDYQEFVMSFRDMQYTYENYQQLQNTIDKFKNADQELPGILDKTTGDVTIMFFEKGMAEVYYVKDNDLGNARKEVYGGTDDSMSVRKTFRVNTDMQIYTFVCRPDGEMRRGFMYISMGDIHPSVLPSNIVEYCEKAGGCT